MRKKKKAEDSAVVTPRASFDLQRLADDFRDLDPNEPGQWPLAPQLAVFAGLLVAVLAAFWWFDWQEQQETLERRQQEELDLRQSWLVKKRQAVNLDEHKRQLDEIDQQIGALLKQLPNRAEMDSLLSDINQAGLGRGLQFELFKPGADVVKEFYAEMPIDIRVTGTYHEIGEFAGDVAKMPRIVTLNNIVLTGDKDDRLKLEAKAVTYRYLDEDELATQRQQAKDAASKQKGRRR